jgi:hypothetical protein
MIRSGSGFPFPVPPALGLVSPNQSQTHLGLGLERGLTAAKTLRVAHETTPSVQRHSTSQPLKDGSLKGKCATEGRLNLASLFAPSAATANLVQSVAFANGFLQMRLSDSAPAVILESSTNLMDWQPASGIVQEGASLRAAVGAEPRRFFRVRTSSTPP